MKTRIIVSVIAVPLLFVILFFLPPWCLGVFTAALCAMAAREFLHAVGDELPGSLRIGTMVLAALLPLSVVLNKSGASIAVGVVGLLALFSVAIRLYEKEKPVPVEGLLACVFAGIVYPTMMSALVGLKGMDNGRLLVLIPIVVTFLCDSCAYFTGVAIGRKKVTPLVSPHKSLEGFAGGIVGGILFLMVYGGIVDLASAVTVNYLRLLLYGAVGSIACELGDLVYSLIKRECGIKDYGNLIPGHGGILDRFDSMSFVAPLMYALVLLLPAFQ